MESSFLYKVENIFVYKSHQYSRFTRYSAFGVAMLFVFLSAISINAGDGILSVFSLIFYSFSFESLLWHQHINWSYLIFAHIFRHTDAKNDPIDLNPNFYEKFKYPIISCPYEQCRNVIMYSNALEHGLLCQRACLGTKSHWTLNENQCHWMCQLWYVDYLSIVWSIFTFTTPISPTVCV